MSIIRYTLVIALLLTASAASAQDWQTVKGSTLTFSSRFQGEPFIGEFSKFSAQIRFDPKALGQSRFDVLIDLSSANSQNSERDDTLKTKEFFDIKKTTSARYTATHFKDLGKGRFQADGQLSLRGITKPVSMVFTWTQNKTVVMVGEAVVNRLSFNVGSGDWADTQLLPNAVKVQTQLILIPKTAAKP